MKTLQEITSYISTALAVNNSIKGNAKLRALTQKLHGWQKRALSDLPRGRERQDPGKEQHHKQALFMWLIATAITSTDDLTNFSAHKLLEKCFSHQEITHYLENGKNSLIKQFRDRYCPTVSFVEKSATTTLKPRVTPGILRGNLCRSIFSGLDTASVMRHRKISRHHYLVATLEIFSRYGEEPKPVQTNLMKKWLTDPSSWDSFQSMFLSDERYKETMEGYLKERLQDASTCDPEQAWKIQSLLAKISGKSLEVDQSHIESALENVEGRMERSQGFDSRLQNIMSPLCKQLKAFNSQLSVDNRERAIEFLKECVNNSDFYMVPQSMKALAGLAVYLDEIPDAIIESMVFAIVEGGELEAESGFTAIRIMLPKLSVSQIASLVERVLSEDMRDNETNVGDAFIILTAISPKLTSDKCVELCVDLASKLSGGNDACMNKNILTCLSGLAKQLDRAIPDELIQCLAGYLLLRKKMTCDPDFEYQRKEAVSMLVRETQKVLAQVMQKASYRQWTKTVELLLCKQCDITPHRLANGVIVAMSFGLSVVPMSVMDKVMSMVGSGNLTDAVCCDEFLEDASSLVSPSPWFNALTDKIFLMKEDSGMSASVSDLFYRLTSMANSFSEKTTESLFEESLSVIRTPIPDNFYEAREEYLFKHRRRFSGIILIESMASSLTTTDINKSIAAIHDCAEIYAKEVGRRDKRIDRALISLIEKLPTLSDAIVNRYQFKMLEYPILKLLIKKLSFDQCEQLAAQAHPKIMDDKLYTMERKSACALLGLLSQSLPASESDIIERDLLTLVRQPNDVDYELAGSAGLALCDLYERDGNFADVLLKSFLHSLLSGNECRSRVAMKGLNRMLPHLSAAQLGKINELADTKLPTNLEFASFRLSANAYHATMSDSCSLAPACHSESHFSV